MAGTDASATNHTGTTTASITWGIAAIKENDMIENLFVRAMYKMLADGEMEKVEGQLRRQGKYWEADKTKEIIESMKEYNVPFIPLLLESRSVELLQDAICYMVHDCYTDVDDQYTLDNNVIQKIMKKGAK